MKKIVTWIDTDGNNNIEWKKFYYFEALLKDVIGVSLNQSLSCDMVKAIAEKLKSLPYKRYFIHEYTIFDDDYKRLQLDFKKYADRGYKLEVRYEEAKVYREPELSIRY